MSTSRILVVEDETTLREMLTYNLEAEGYAVSAAADGLTALEMARAVHPDLILLDVMLPGLDGFDLCRILRQEMVVPILMLTAKEEEVDKILGLELGADDYMTKPFSMRELKARVKAMLRRVEMLQPKEEEPTTITIGDTAIDFSRRKVTVDSVGINMKPREFDLLAYLAKNRGHVFSRDHLLDRVWGYDWDGDTRTVDVHIRWLREKIEVDPSKPEKLVTVRGVGYKFEG